MPCNYLMRFKDQETFEHMVIENCNSSTPMGASVRYFNKNNKKVRISTFEEDTKELECIVECLYQEGAAIFIDSFKIEIGDVNMIKDSTKPYSPENSMLGKSFVPRRLDSKVIEIIPSLQKHLNYKSESLPEPKEE